MAETGSLDIGIPDEGGGGASEELSEQAAQRFAASQQAAAQQAKQEKKSKKRDDNVAQVIVQFLTDTQKTHLATLIARLVSRDCPTTFLLAILSLINEKCLNAVEEYLRERGIESPSADSIDQSIIPANSALSDDANAALAQWVVRMETALKLDEDAVIHALIVEDNNIDGTVLQLTAFVLQEFLTAREKSVPFENLQQLSAGILQSLFTPAMHAHMERRLKEPKSEDDE
jgi:hypothetical protein